MPLFQMGDTADRERSTRATFTVTYPFELPGFTYRPPPYGGLSFRFPVGAGVNAVHDSFVERVVSAVGRSYLPVYRMADGEFKFMVGERALLPAGVLHRTVHSVASFARRVTGRSATCWGEVYAAADRVRAAARFRSALVHVARAGMLAMYFANRKDEWGAAYFEPVCDWLDRHAIPLNATNYVPFYSVYALLSGPVRTELFVGRRVLVATHVSDSRRAALRSGMLAEGCAAVEFLPVSRTQSLLDVLDLRRVQDSPDLVLVAAGIGSVNVLAQLEPLGVPCIDCGIALECIIAQNRRWERPFLIGDDRTSVNELAARRQF
jgi:hypothetical protein